MQRTNQIGGDRPETIFKTNDLYFAAFLQASGVRMIRTEREGTGKKVAFVFDTSIVNFQELKNDYFAQTAKIAALPYANTVKNLKAICHLT